MIFKFAARNLLKRPFLNLVKVVGLNLALSGILLIVLFLKNELTYDSFHSKADNIYRFTVSNQFLDSEKYFARVFNTEFIPHMSEYFSEIENYVRLIPINGGVVKHEEEFIKVNQAFQCDSTFFKVFDAQLLMGNPHQLLNHPGSMVVSESFAKKVFGKQNPIGQILTLPAGQYYGQKIDFTIQGIMKDFPQNSHFHPEFIATPGDENAFNQWAWTYLLLSDHAPPGNISSGFKEFFASHIGKGIDEIETEAQLQNIRNIHLHSHKLREIEANSNMSVIYTLSIAALILLFIALINYVNLNIGMANFSEKYLFVSRVVGSSNWMSLKYFFYEGLIVAAVSMVLSAFITTLAHGFIQEQFALNLFHGNFMLVLAVVFLFIILSLLVGILPLSKQVNISKKSSLNYRHQISFNRKGISKTLIVLQYTISIALIVAVIVIQRQTSFALQNSMGVEAEELVCFENVHSDVQSKFELFKEELLKNNSIKSVSAMLEPPGGEANDMMRFKMEGYTASEMENDNMIGIFPCDYSFASIFNLNFLSGRNFSQKNGDNEGSGEYIINESALRRLNYSNPEEIIGKEFGLFFSQPEIKIPSGKIIGVVEDFHLSSLKKKVEPLVLFKREDLWLMNFVVSFQPGRQKEALSDLEAVWTKMYPEHPFQYGYVSAMYRQVYQTELLQAKLLSVFTFVALFICSMGLLGMSLLTTQRRTKEIGIRKVNGARISELMIMLNWYFLKWIMISFLIAIPLVVMAMNKWLENFAYKIDLSWWIFALAGIVTICIAFLTVSVQSWKAANTNPVKALKYE